MARSLARRKRTAAKSHKSARHSRRLPAKKKTRSSSRSKKSTSLAKRGLARAGHKPAAKAKKKAKRAKRSTQQPTAPAVQGPRKRIPMFGIPTPAPEKPPPLLSESKATTAALAHLEKGIKLLYQKEFKKARAEFESIAEIYPGEAEIIARARSYLQICAREEAAHKKQSVANHQIYTLGVMEHNRGNFDAAILYFLESLEKHPNSDYIYYSLAAAQAMKNDVSEALQNLRKAIELNEDNRIYAKNDQDFTNLHSEKDFADLVGLKVVASAEPSQS